MSSSTAFADSGGLWPTPHQHLALRAALLDGEAARSAFREWRASIDLDADFDRGTFRLVPLLYENLRRLEVEDPLMGRLKGVYRLSWYKAHRLFHDLAPVLYELEAAGIRTLLLKGAPLALAYYKSPALRPMADLDVLVPERDASRAIAWLEQRGWQRHATASDESLLYRHAMQFRSTDGLELDLHWHALYESGRAATDALFWDHAVPLDFEGVATRRPDTTLLLLHTIVHGVRWNPEPPLRWIPDALALLRAPAEPIDWDLVLQTARACKLTHRLRLGLEHLARTLDAPVPIDVQLALARARTSLVERIENSCILRDTEELSRGALGKVWVYLGDYVRVAPPCGPLGFALGFSHYLRYRLRMRGRSEIPGMVLRGAWKRLRRA